VTRVTPIPDSTALINHDYQRLLAGTPWANYQLVATQWPTVRNGASFRLDGTYPSDSDSPFPADHVANTAAETYFQNQGRTSCMQCHYETASTDFSWILALRAFQLSPSQSAKTTAKLLRILATPTQ
jgi:hypothetical protein